MASVAALHAGVLALFPGDVAVFDGAVPANTPPPWVFVLVDLPVPVERSLGRTSLAHRCVVRVRISGTSTASVRVIADKVLPALENVRPVAAGWQTSGLELQGDPRTDPDYDVTLTVMNTRPVTSYTDWAFMAQPTT